MNHTQTALSTRPARAKSTRFGPPRRTPVSGASTAHAPVVTVTENALKYIRDQRASLGLPVKGIRVTAIPRSALRSDYRIRFVPAEEPESPLDSIQSFEGIDLYIAADSAPYLEGATIDFVFRLIGSELKVRVPFRNDTPEGRVAVKVQQVLDEVVNPSLSTHGGGAELIDFRDGVVFLELTGGCQGCSMADNTLKNGIEKSILEGVPEVQEVRDVTQHANGRNPFYQ
ncbi:MAG: NifU family protein [Verrucomicrobia bacterium]|nr:NifU family protein [Verrucomicrobiota bacterium]